MYETRLLSEDDFRTFKTLYEDFKVRALADYKFELEPLPYEDFVDAIKQNYINCIVLYESGIPVAFLIYTTVVSEAIELNIIHSLKMENKAERSAVLTKKFLDFTKVARRNKVVCYPMLGAQTDLISEMAILGFKFVGIAVLRFMTTGTNSREILQLTKLSELDRRFKVVPWSNNYTQDAVKVVNEAFKESADALFDPRFKSIEGTADIIHKIVENIYAEFLPESTSVLLYDDKPVGFCFMNLTAGKIANIPLVAILKQYQGLGLSKHMLKSSLQTVLRWVDAGVRPITEVNTNTETNNFAALKMYRHLGFKEDYSYPQAYLPVKY